MPTTRDVVLSAVIAVSAGGAASLALVTQPNLVETPWRQVIDTIVDDVSSKASCRCDATVEVIPLLTHQGIDAASAGRREPA